MATCGVWMTPHRLVAVAVDDRGVVLGPAHTATRNDDARWDLVTSIEAHHGLDCVFVVTAALHLNDTLPRIAARRGSSVVIVPDHLVEPACLLNGFSRARASPRRLALLIARLALCRPFSERLLRLELQLTLF